MWCNNYNIPIIRCISEVGAKRKGIRYKIIVQYKSHLTHFTALILQWLRPDICIPNNLPPCYVAMNNFGRHRADDDVWYSPPFYSGPRGYKMRLLVYANGRGSGEGSHVSVYVQIIQGQFDGILTWPYEGSITFEIINWKNDKAHKTVYVDFFGQMQLIVAIDQQERTVI